MSASASSKSTNSESSCKRKKSEEADIQRKRPYSRSQSVDRFTEDVRDAQNREVGDGGDPDIPIISALPSPVPPIIPEAPSMNRGNGETQSREVGGGVNPDFPIPEEASTTAKETPSITLFQGSSNLQISNTNFTAIGGNATIIRFGDGQFTEVQRDLICDYIATLTALPDMNDNLKKHILTQLIILLPRAEAVFNDYQNKKKSGPCFKGTRVALLKEMANWVTGQDESKMYILSGLAGIGKSTVAYTIASRAADLNLLGASFFFSRDEADRNNAKKLFTTVAYQLCAYDESFAQAIGDALQTKRGSAATTKDPREQLQVLILDPLRNIVQSRTRPILIVVDALDECNEDDVYAVVEGLSQLVRELPSFKVILTTRPQPYFDAFLVNQGNHKLFRLQDIEYKVVDSDIRLYLKHNLSLEQVRKLFPRRQWCASDEQIDTLVRAAGRLFIIASTSVRYILDKSACNPAAQMQELLRACAQDHTPFTDLDDFYTIILRNVVPANCINKSIVSRYQSVISAIVFVSRPLPVSTLTHLIDIDVDDIHVVLEKLQSVILLGDDDVPRIYHKSFPDYLTDQARCKDSCLRIDPRISHTQIATRCFEITNKYLKYNILGLGDVARYMRNEDSLKKDRITKANLQEKIPLQLRYASVYLSNHLEIANIEDTDLMNGLEKFVDEHTLHWFEVLSLIGNLNSAHRAIRVIIKHLKSTSSDLHKLLSDALRFISRFYEVIERSALHTYYSALPFSPTYSLLYRRYIKEVEDNMCSIEGGPEKWDALIANPTHGEKLGASVIKFSLDNTMFVSCSEKFGYEDDVRMDICSPGRLKIWDAATGTPISTIAGSIFVFANDFSTIASSEANTVTYYNAHGIITGTGFTTSSKILKLALSESTSRVAAGLSDGTVWLWDSRNAKLIGSFGEFDSTRRSCLEFSCAGTSLAYPCKNGILKLLDGISGRFIADLSVGFPENGVRENASASTQSNDMFVFSDDGSRIASLSRNRVLALWNTESGGRIGIAFLDTVDYWRARSPLAISANGSLLATVSGDHEVTLWREKSDRLARIEVLHERAQSMAFSADNILAIGTSRYCIMLYNTNTNCFISILPLHGEPTALAFSPDCTHLAGGNTFGTMYLWDMREIDTPDSYPPSSLRETAATAVALSRDCSRLVCGFGDGTVELWETSPLKQRNISPRGHYRVATVGFAPDSMLFASGSYDGTIKLRNSGDGSLHGTLKAPVGLKMMALSNSVLVASGEYDATLWSLDTQSLIHTLKVKAGSDTISDAVSISDEGDLAAIAFKNNSVFLFNVMNGTAINMFTTSDTIYKLTFLPNKSQLVVQTNTGNFLSFDLINNCITNETTLEQLIQLPDIPLWHGVPIWSCCTDREHYFSALFSQHQSPVPVLWIPSDISIDICTQGSSIIALTCKGGRIIFLRLPTSHVN